MSLRDRLIVISLAVVLASLPAAASSAATDEDGKAKSVLNQVSLAWKMREATIRSGEFAWKEASVMSRSASDYKGDPFGPGPGSEPKGTVTDRKTFRHECRAELLFKAEKLRYSTNEPAWSVAAKEFKQYEYLRVFDGRQFMDLVKRDLPDAFQYQGGISPASADSIRTMLALRPLLLHFQPFRTDAQFLSRFRRVKFGAVVDGKPCAILQASRDPEGRVVESLWLDPEKGYSILRMVTQHGSVVTTQFDMGYDADARYGPVLSRWKFTGHFANGEFDRSIEAATTTAKVNHEIADDRFTLDFPVNTAVIDRSRPSEGNRYYIVRPNGGKRVILPAELARAQTPDELMNTETGQAGIRPQRSAWFRFLLPATVVFLALVVAFCAYRARRATAR